MFFALLLSTFTLSAPHSGIVKVMPQDTVTIHGFSWDVSSGLDIKVKATALLKNGKVSLGESNDEGKFELRLPETTQHVVFEREGYRTEIIPVNFIGTMESHYRFQMHVEMIKKDSQQVNKVLFAEVSDPAKPSQQRKKLFFEVKEAKNRKLLSAKVCLNFTQTGNVECYDVDSTKTNFSIPVNTQDKISFIVSSPGHKDYIGNLINNQPENREEFYQIRLLRDVVTLSMSLEAPKNLPIFYNLSSRKEERFDKDSWSMGQPGHFQSYQSFIGTGLHYLTATAGKEILLDESFTIERGFNFMGVKPKVPKQDVAVEPEAALPKPLFTEIKPNPEAKKETAKIRTYDSTVLYFDQSSYHLRNATKQTLDSIAHLLAEQNRLMVSITGHSDNVGKRDLNVTLSEYRARVVTNYLKENGVQPMQLSYTWKGPDAPAASNDSPENKMKNRRVVIRYGER
ncbi:OmpA family protein [Dyadobacter psychrotolerans]|uniref:OmpA family protein n=1 Tax=Dyadobacter psychrotolerans TaxID=2541721 RepID=A0A4V2Z402_9BACT|nr:OmpA family protein [Dyadobacter psychrotolerans]TDE14698.1 OmpA family protein [Dyadobacter psychrotolerans]